MIGNELGLLGEVMLDPNLEQPQEISYLESERGIERDRERDREVRLG